ncbi:hypothetical protein L198_01440 [Cryptococcus wingfieldii CBS 7118]|uniref:Uncharacterized protein n=1 Tax=Cryptococcus wingfieldii CBS 7118 TaxID=1295528 RepID=A0A1E3JZ97_9TREE|nr:hypothetical protein L198_01440 [Cryptococcus wingfieldii CBS 7118]ODO06208.1 hypothetical protein L198_01440 [Cryptococcus wingfieldii CBS 7118]
MFGIRAYQDSAIWKKPNWEPLYFALGFTCLFFLIRSVFRTVELSDGYIGYLATHEGYLFGLDTLPLLLGVAICTVGSGQGGISRLTETLSSAGTLVLKGQQMRRGLRMSIL